MYKQFVQAIFTICVALICFLPSVHAQSSSNPSKESKAILKQARKHYRAGDFRDAVPEYESILHDYADDSKVIFELGVSYLHSYQQPKDLEFLERSYNMEGKTNKKINYWLGRANHLNYNFGKAHEFYELYLNQLRRFQRSQRTDIENLMEQSRYAKHLCEIPQRYIIEKVEGGINSEFSEHSPITSMDGSTLIYTSRHPNEVNNMEMDVGGAYREKIYYTTKNDSGRWNTPILLDIDPEFKNHLATMQLFDNATKMLLYKSTHQGDIYYSEKQADSSWSVPTEYQNINSTEWEADVYLSRNDDIIFVSTDRFTKDGNLNIYYSERLADSSWGELIDVGDSVNTPFDENSPFLSNDGKRLYFSSNGHKSMGGYDVFMVERDSVTGNWGTPQNMGYPINTPDDDVYFYFGYNGWTGYTSSYRTGGLGEKDIYKITFVPNVNIAGRIISGETNELLDSVEICFQAINTDTNFVECDLTNDLDGLYNVNILSNQPYKVIFTKNGEVLDELEYSVPFLVEGDPTYYKRDFVLFKDTASDSLRFRLLEVSELIMDSIRLRLRANMEKLAYREKPKLALHRDLQEFLKEVEEIIDEPMIDTVMVEDEEPLLVMDDDEPIITKLSSESEKTIVDTVAEITLLILGTTATTDGSILSDVKVDLVNDFFDIEQSDKSSQYGKYRFELNRKVKSGSSNPDLRTTHVLLANYEGVFLSKVPERKEGNKYVADFVFDVHSPRLQIRVKDEKTKLPLEQVRMKLTNRATAQVESHVINEQKFALALTGRKKGETIQCSIVFEKNGYESKTTKVAMVLGEDSTNVITVELTKKAPEPLVVRKIEKHVEPKSKEEDIIVLDENGELKKVKNLYFPFDSYKFESKYYASLDYLAELLNERDDIIVKILGHADDKGAAAYNIKLSGSRAKNVYDYLISKNVSEEQLLTKSMGYSMPLVSNDDESDGRELNRRVEFIVYKAVK